MMTHSYKGWVIFYFRIYKKSIYIGGKNDEELEKEVFLISPGIPGNISVGGQSRTRLQGYSKYFY